MWVQSGMKTIHFDESGDLGFDFTKQGTSGHFIATFLISTNHKSVISAVKKVFRTMSGTEIKHSHGVLHAYYEKKETRIKLLRYLAERDIQIAVMRYDKRKVLVADDEHTIYNSIVTTLINRLYIEGFIGRDEEIHLIASRKNTNRQLNEQFKTVVLGNSKPPSLSVDVIKPSDDKALQAVDFVSWAFQNKYETGNSSYTDIVAEKVIREYDYF
jgi:hypothetical protein